MLAKWHQFLKRTKLSLFAYSDVLNLIKHFLGCVWGAIITEDEYLIVLDRRLKRWQTYGSTKLEN